MLLNKAVSKGSRRAMVFLAEMYMSGEEIPRDVQKGIRYFTRAANAGDVYAMNRLAIST